MDQLKILSKDIIEAEKRKFINGWPWYLFSAAVFFLLPYLNYQYLDGNTHSRVLTFNVDPLDLATSQPAYCPGDTVYIEQSFCKNRYVESYTSQWWMENGQTVPVSFSSSETGASQLPLGCYPKEGGTTDFAVHSIPPNTEPGVHTSIGLTIHQLSSNRSRTDLYRTREYIVLPPEACPLQL